MFIRSPGNLIELEHSPWSQVVSTSEYGLLNQPILAHVVSKYKRCSTVHWFSQRGFQD